MEDINQEVVKLSKINSASLINMRINNLWLEVNKAAVAGNYFRWNSNLDRVWCELIGDVKRKDDEDIENEGEGEDEENKVKKKKVERKTDQIDEFNELDKEVSEKLQEIQLKEGFSKVSNKEKKGMAQAYTSLMKKEAFLRRLMNKQGKGTAYEEAWDDYIDG